MNAEVNQIIANDIGQQYFHGSEEIKAGNHTLYVQHSDLKVVVYKGKSQKPLYNFIFEVSADLKEWIAAKVQKFKNEFEDKEKAKLYKANLQHSLQVGDVLVCDCHSHLIRFFQVTKLVDRKKILVREINQLQVADSNSGGYCSPLKDSFKSVEFAASICGENNFMKVTKYLFMKPLKKEISANLKNYARLLNTAYEPVAFQING